MSAGQFDHQGIERRSFVYPMMMQSVSNQSHCFFWKALLCAAVAIYSYAGPTKAESPQINGRSEIKAARAKAANRQRRIIFNNDGNEPVNILQRPSKQDFLDARTTPLVGTQVDSIFYCTAFGSFGVFNHLTKVGSVFASKEGRYANNQMEALAAAGIDPLEVMVEFCKQNNIEIFWSMRMNDTHDGAKADYGPIMFRASKLKNEHPEYLLGLPEKRPKHGAWTAVNYALPEVRELAFRFFEEVCTNYDIDGVELDFFRHPVFFPSTASGEPATDDQRAAMTDLLKRIRTMADEVGKQRGQPILIAVKTPDSVEYARSIGLDLENWMADGLIDLFIPGGYFQLNNWNYSVALAHKHGVKIYPSLDESRVRDKTAQKMRSTPLAYRGRAANAWAAGADGIYIFNHFDPNSPVLREVGDAKRLAQLDKDYFASIRGALGAAGGNFSYAKFQNLETLNPGNPKTVQPGNNATATIYVAETSEQSQTAKMKLRLRFQQAPTLGDISVRLNDKPLQPTKTDDEWLECANIADDLRPGANVVVVASSASGSTQVHWTDLMLEVRRSDADKSGQ